MLLSLFLRKALPRPIFWLPFFLLAMSSMKVILAVKHCVCPCINYSKAGLEVDSGIAGLRLTALPPQPVDRLLGCCLQLHKPLKDPLLT